MPTIFTIYMQCSVKLIYTCTVSNVPSVAYGGHLDILCRGNLVLEPGLGYLAGGSEVLVLTLGGAHSQPPPLEGLLLLALDLGLGAPLVNGVRDRSCGDGRRETHGEHNSLALSISLSLSLTHIHTHADCVCVFWFLKITWIKKNQMTCPSDLL